MRLEIHNRCSEYDSYRAARVKSLFNAETGANFDFEIDVDLTGDWNIGVVVGPSGSGKTSIGKTIFPGVPIHDYSQGWDNTKPIVDCIAPESDFNQVTGALAAVGLGSVPTWLRPFQVLSNGEQFRAGLARLICEKPEQVVIDEFTSVVDRQIAKVGSTAFQKSWRRSNPDGKVVLLTPHYDVLDWLEPDWILDTREKRFIREPGRRLRRRPEISLEIRKTNGSYWRFFKPHYYLDLPMPVAAEYFVGTVDGELVCHLAVAPMFTASAYRATRLVVMPEWQGTGVGTTFLDWVTQYHLEGNGRKGKTFPTFFHTSHPQLAGALRKRRGWRQTSAILFGANKKRSMQSITRSQKKQGKKQITSAGYGGHFRAIQGFKYEGKEKKC